MSITNAAEPSTNAVFPLSISGLSSVGPGYGDVLLVDADRAAFAADWVTSQRRPRRCESGWGRCLVSAGAIYLGAPCREMATPISQARMSKSPMSMPMKMGVAPWTAFTGLVACRLAGSSR
jgi:hypothetical protein